MRLRAGPGTNPQPQTESGRSQERRKTHLLFAAGVGLLALLLLGAGIVALLVFGVGSEDNIFAVPLLSGGLGAAALTE
ncbi:MAG: hypothetical protein ABI670_11385 [Chloroflexota bacterium]